MAAATVAGTPTGRQRRRVRPGNPPDATVPPPPPICPAADEQCPEAFTFPFSNEMTVALCGSLQPDRRG